MCAAASSCSLERIWAIPKLKLELVIPEMKFDYGGVKLKEKTRIPLALALRADPGPAMTPSALRPRGLLHLRRLGFVVLSALMAHKGQWPLDLTGTALRNRKKWPQRCLCQWHDWIYIQEEMN